jgi:ketosteroid isomerase-like protein
MKVLTILFVTSMFLTTAAMANDVEDVKEAVLSLFAAVNAGAAGSRASHRMPEFSSFGRGGGLLDRSTSREERRKAFQASVAAGFKRNYQPRNIEVRVYGNTAVVTCYLVGTVTAPNGDITRWTDRRTGVWVTQGGKWREVHMHQSPLNLPQ